MNAVSLGVAGWLLILAAGGGAGLPMGVPPAPEDPLLSRVAPEKCIFYTSWAGTAEPDPKSENHAERLLAEPEIQHLIAEIERRIKTSLSELAEEEDPQAAPLVEDATGWVKTLLTHPTAVFISQAKLGPDGPDVRAGMLVRVGDEVGKLKAALEKHQAKHLGEAAETVKIGGGTWQRIKLPDGAPPVTWGTKGKYLIAGVGEGAVEGILRRAKTPAPDWLTGLRKQLPLERTATVSYLDLKTIIETFAPLGGEEATAVIAAAGLGNVTSLCSVTGLDKTGFVSRTLLDIDGEPAGLLRLAAQEPLSAEDLAPIPRDATIALAGRLDAEHVLETILSVAEKVEPRVRADILEGLGEIEEELGIDLRQDVLKPLGSAWCVYNSPGEGGLVFTGLTAVVRVDDHQRLAAAHEKLLAKARSQMQRDDERGRRGPKIEQFKFAGEDVYFFNARDSEFPLAPAWCLREKELIVAPFPQNIKAYLSRGHDFQSLAEVPEVAGLFQPQRGPLLLTYYDARKLFELIYPFVPMAAQAAFSEMSREGIDVDVSILPSASAIGKHLRPGVAAVRRTADGIELVSRQTIPSGNVGAAFPTAASMLIPAVQAARQAARRVASMNNLKQIGLAMHNYHATHRKFPAAYSSDEEGKPMLSWRVHVLPYVEAQGLYERFKLDEPWDSQHNKKLIPLMPEIYRSPTSRAAPGMATYLTVRGEKTAFSGKRGIRMADLRDGTSNTIMAVEVDDKSAVVWTKPDDYSYDPKDPTAGLTGAENGFNAAFCDGSVRALPKSIDPDTLKALFTRDGGEPIDPDELFYRPRRGRGIGFGSRHEKPAAKVFRDEVGDDVGDDVSVEEAIEMKLVPAEPPSREEKLEDEAVEEPLPSR